MRFRRCASTFSTLTQEQRSPIWILGNALRYQHVFPCVACRSIDLPKIDAQENSCCSSAQNLIVQFFLLLWSAPMANLQSTLPPRTPSYIIQESTTCGNFQNCNCNFPNSMNSTCWTTTALIIHETLSENSTHRNHLNCCINFLDVMSTQTKKRFGKMATA